MATRSNNQKPHIVDAAFRVVSQSGASHLTIDAVAAEARLSKGGVLYHFPNKRALLTGMLRTLIESIAPTTMQEPELLVQHIERERSQTNRERAAGLAILAAASEDPGLLDPARELIQQLFVRTEADFVDPQLAHILLLATEGLRFLRMLELWPESEAASDALHDRLAAMAQALETA